MFLKLQRGTRTLSGSERETKVSLVFYFFLFVSLLVTLSCKTFQRPALKELNAYMLNAFVPEKNIERL